LVEILNIYFRKLFKILLSSCGKSVPGSPEDTKILRCSCPFYKMVARLAPVATQRQRDQEDLDSRPGQIVQDPISKIANRKKGW
jgi:hypothetical protein